MKTKFLIAIVGYGIFATFLSVWQWPNDGLGFILNLPGNLLGEITYHNSIGYMGDPVSPQAHYTIPWILRMPQVVIPISMTFWAGIGTIIQLLSNTLVKANGNKNLQ